METLSLLGNSELWRSTDYHAWAVGGDMPFPSFIMVVMGYHSAFKIKNHFIAFMAAYEAGVAEILLISTISMLLEIGLSSDSYSGFGLCLHVRAFALHV